MSNFFSQKFHSTTGETEVRIKQIADFLCAGNSQIFHTRVFAGFWILFLGNVCTREKRQTYWVTVEKYRISVKIFLIIVLKVFSNNPKAGSTLVCKPTLLSYQWCVIWARVGLTSMSLSNASQLYPGHKNYEKGIKMKVLRSPPPPPPPNIHCMGIRIRALRQKVVYGFWGLERGNLSNKYVKSSLIKKVTSDHENKIKIEESKFDAHIDLFKNWTACLPGSAWI